MIEPAQLSAPRRRTVRYTASALGGLVLLWLVAFIAAGDGVPRGTTVLGVSIGGMTPQRAEATLVRELADDAKAAVPVRVGDERLEIDPATAGLALDAAATVDEAGQRSWNPFALVAGLLGEGDMDPSVTVDRGKLSHAVGVMAQHIDGKPVEGGVRFDGDQVVPVQPRQGRTVDRGDAVDKIGESYLSEDLPVELTAQLVDPKVGSAEVQRAVREFAEPAMSGPVELTVDGEPVTLPPSLIGPALAMSPNDAYRLEPVLDGAKLKASLADELKPFERKARDATFRISGGRPRVVPAKPGSTIDPDQLSLAVLPALTLAGDARAAALSLTESTPKLSTAQAKALRITELVSEFTTFYPSNFPPRLTNIHRAADLMDNTLLLPGKTFSLNKEVGERTGARGFAQGYVISGGRLRGRLRRRCLAARNDNVQRCVLRRPRGRRAPPAQLLHQPLPRRARSDGRVGSQGPPVPQRHRHRHLHHHELHQQFGHGADVGDQDLHRWHLEVRSLQRPAVRHRLQQEARRQPPPVTACRSPAYQGSRST